ncbi:hypothetical protein KFK14_13915 [Sphingobium phenoxybenzoativorans]|uniref:Uncharacterized protein n=1 Tax=Sphingobium phenoxybenzoativorans TaxID=1592790 RepID=A0A975Q0E3_9SPHN|nr:hypothetical protein [Sphingobium phenoxybenzoativorans]QUT04227.1 hypothetical protein KFK14_13915 [Sphingobium phenoxybenzoativorans]
MNSMTPQEREAFYDREIAPALLSLSRRCAQHGISFMALAEWAPGSVGRTVNMAPGHSDTLPLANKAVAVSGNTDAMIHALIKEGKKDGHSSIYLFELGVPFEGMAGD